MAAGWTQDRVVQLAPDAASLKAGQGLASAKKWVSLGRDELFAWGECQGSGAKPYQVQFDLTEAGSKCSCPSRKFPCKHALGLMLMLTASADVIGRQEMPAWVAEWVAGRAERAKKKQEKAEAPPKPVDEAAQANRLEKRMARIGAGLAALKIWVQDLVKAGIATAPSRGFGFFDETARRLIDAQAPGVAGRVQRLGQIAASGAGWQGPFMSVLAGVYLLIRAFEGIEALPESVRDDVLANIGIPLRPEDVAALAPTHDTWQVLAQEVELEDRLRVLRTWLFGRESRRPALVLAFAHGNAALDTSLAAGTCFEGDLCFYPGNGVRAALRSRGELKPMGAFRGLVNLDELCDVAAEHFAKEPWLAEVAAPLHGVTPSRSGEQWMVLDGRQRAVPARFSEQAGWLALAMAGGKPVDLMAGYDGRVLRPLAMIAGGEYVSLTMPG
jgi:hypothetical protein